jgi:hypothetical protein
MMRLGLIALSHHPIISLLQKTVAKHDHPRLHYTPLENWGRTEGIKKGEDAIVSAAEEESTPSTFRGPIYQR